MTLEPTTTCTCGARIAWVDTEHGSSMPVDPEPADDGNLEIDEDLFGRRVCRVVAPGAGRYRPHWPSCPDATTHRRRDRADAE